jgi:ElaB/YqjD/DUF883 family membrane-anchored ribosome-binding protein
MTQSSSTYNRGTDYSRSTDDLANKASNLAGKAGEQLDRVAQDVESAAHSFAEQGRQATEQVQIVADNFKSAVDKSVREQPLTTLAMAAGLGFVIGAIWKS